MWVGGRGEGIISCDFLMLSTWPSSAIENWVSSERFFLAWESRCTPFYMLVYCEHSNIHFVVGGICVRKMVTVVLCGVGCGGGGSEL